ncbi:uncharacterized mitochondrial protein AtMg00820-like [Rosa chinensis]|uniref:uncharacterized mitochondrial protein AtMg00820-like n=1 Tax=Rosa chinensis TaxID=74649 RepID=UPI000D097B9F|nr:uncharacterized mitochondrial protein AtMg00820-like [Rosa chinensis]
MSIGPETNDTPAETEKAIAEQRIASSETEKDAMKDEKWAKEMAVEMDALEKNQTWELVSLTPGKKTVGCRWVYIVKHNSDGSVDKYKARLVAKGYTRKYGVDYDEIFAPVAKINTIRVLLLINLNEEVYMDFASEIWYFHWSQGGVSFKEVPIWSQTMSKSLVWPIHDIHEEDWFMHNPSKAHMEAEVRILRHLKSAPGRGLVFSKHRHLDVLEYTDS